MKKVEEINAKDVRKHFYKRKGSQSSANGTKLKKRPCRVNLKNAQNTLFLQKSLKSMCTLKTNILCVVNAKANVEQRRNQKCTSK